MVAPGKNFILIVIQDQKRDKKEENDWPHKSYESSYFILNMPHLF